MLTIFTCPKPFEGHIGLIQRNALRTWMCLPGEVEVFLMGDEPGICEAAAEFKVRHIPKLRKNENGTPLISSVFEKAQSAASGELMLFINSDIMLTDDIHAIVDEISFEQFLVVGQRINLDIDSEWDTDSSNWRELLQDRSKREGCLQKPAGMDYFLFRKGLWNDMPEFAMGRFIWDNWLVWSAINKSVPVIDATDVLLAIHQNHGYEHIVEHGFDPRRTQEALQNRLMGIQGRWYSHRDATWKLKRIVTDKGNRRLRLIHNWARIAKPGIRLLRRAMEQVGMEIDAKKSAKAI